MGSTSDANDERPVYQTLGCRTVAEIQGNVDKKRDKNLFLRLLNVKSDKDAIASWDRDLARVLRVFSVRSAGPDWRLLIGFF